MAATPSGFAYARPTPTTPAARGALGLRALAVVVAVACVACGLTIASAYPIEPLVAMGLFVAWTAFAALRFPLAWPALIAAVPLVGFATWTGWLTFEEIDLVVLATAAGGYGALALGRAPDPGAPRERPKLSVLSIVLLAAFLASTIVALARGIDAGGGLVGFDWSAGYDSPQNAIRIFKSFAFALVLTPLLVGALRRPDGFDRLGLAMTASLALGALLVVRERLAFTGLLDFSDDYRVTGAFWEMHVGGAALDGFLALTVPFAVREALRHASPARFAAAAAVLALAAYACLVTFSRGVYAAVPLAVATAFVLVARQRLRLDRGALWLVFGKAVAFALVIAVCGAIVFRHGGYRATLAAFVVLAAAIPVDAALRRLDVATGVAALLAALVLAAGTALAATVLPKGPYVVFALAAVATAAAVWRFERAPVRSTAAFVVGGWLWLATAAVHVAGFWGGRAALHDSAVLLAGFVVLVLAAARLPRSIWPQARRDQAMTVGIAGIVLGIVAVFAAGAYMGGRFSTSRGDLDVRLAHWTDALGRLHGADWLFGKGLGRFPATSLYEAHDGTAPGTYGIGRRDGESFLVVAGPRLRYIGFNEIFRVSQRVEVEPNRVYDAVLTLRTAKGTGMHVELCEKQLLYPGDCRVMDVGVGPGREWHDVSFRLNTGGIGAMQWFGRRPVFFAVAGGEPGAGLEFRSIRLVDASGRDAIANGRFARGTARWFSSSDRVHLPWHVKNIALDVLFDQGLVGLALFTMLVAAALVRTGVGRARRHPDAPFIAAALVGYLVVGAFDSLLDVPRVALLFFVVVIVALTLRNPRAEPQKAAAPPPPSSAPPPPSVDEAAERARRRQRAFGERRPAQA